MCVECALKTSVTAGTIFHRSHTPLSTWFAAVWFVTSQKNGVSAQGLQDALGFGSYETAWAWLHKLRRAMVRPDRELLGADPAIIVELDQSFLGGTSTGKRGASSDKTPITIAVERTARGHLGRVRLEVADKPGGLDMIDFATEVVTPGAKIHTDGARMFTRLTALGYTHLATPQPRADTRSRTPTPSCPDHTWCPRYSSDGPPARCTIDSATNTCPTTSTSSPSGSTAATHAPEECSSTDSFNKPSVPTLIP